MHKSRSHKRMNHKKMSMIEDWWENLGIERPAHQTIFPYFRCNIGLVDSDLDPDRNKDCERFVATKNARVLTLLPSNESIWVCEKCYNSVKNNPRAYDIYGDKVTCVHNNYKKIAAMHSKNEHGEMV